MILYLIRHAHALDGADDVLRPLSAKGRRQIRTLVRFLRPAGRLEAREFWHSPLVRARDTAARLAGGLKRPLKLAEISHLEPYADPARIAARLQRLRRPVAVVGHEPHLSALATLLLAGRADSPVLKLKKGAVAALERKGRRWSLCWLVSPAETA